MADRMQRRAAAAAAAGGSPTRAARAAEAQAPLLTLEDVAGGSTADLVAKVAGEALRPSTPRQQGGAPQGAGALAELLARFERCGSFGVLAGADSGWVHTSLLTSPCSAHALSHLASNPAPPHTPNPPTPPHRADRELARLQQQADARAERLRRDAAAGGAGQGARVAALEGQWASLRAGLGGLEGRMTAATQAATKIGNRLQVGAEGRAVGLALGCVWLLGWAGGAGCRQPALVQSPHSTPLLWPPPPPPTPECGPVPAARAGRLRRHHAPAGVCARRGPRRPAAAVPRRCSAGRGGGEGRGCLRGMGWRRPAVPAACMWMRWRGGLAHALLHAAPRAAQPLAPTLTHSPVSPPRRPSPASCWRWRRTWPAPGSGRGRAAAGPPTRRQKWCAGLGSGHWGLAARIVRGALSPSGH